mmetsp:Transcript_5040/g.12196  ORF Transcript_5040/g.12196 Transcript_5040/m.12196 type:complete len:132 (-) Transcript_5040:87-482(-)
MRNSRKGVEIHSISSKRSSLHPRSVQKRWIEKSNFLSPLKAADNSFPVLVSAPLSRRMKSESYLPDPNTGTVERKSISASRNYGDHYLCLPEEPPLGEEDRNMQKTGPPTHDKVEPSVAAMPSNVEIPAVD